MDYSSCKRLIDVLVLNFKTMFSARVKGRKMDFCIVLAGKQQKCRDTAPQFKKLLWRVGGEMKHETLASNKSMGVKSPPWKDTKDDRRLDRPSSIAATKGPTLETSASLSFDVENLTFINSFDSKFSWYDYVGPISSFIPPR